MHQRPALDPGRWEAGEAGDRREAVPVKPTTSVGDLAIVINLGPARAGRSCRCAILVSSGWREAEQAGTLCRACIGEARRLPARTIARPQCNPLGQLEVGPMFLGKSVHQVAPEPARTLVTRSPGD